MPKRASARTTDREPTCTVRKAGYQMYIKGLPGGGKVPSGEGDAMEGTREGDDMGGVSPPVTSGGRCRRSSPAAGKYHQGASSSAHRRSSQKSELSPRGRASWSSIHYWTHPTHPSPLSSTTLS
eukprot:9433582-Pyramimonas_sp.AAC.1